MGEKRLAREVSVVYDALLADLRKAILSGRLKPGERLAPETELAANYRISRRSARNALDILCQEGWIDKSQGKGTFVRERKDAEGYIKNKSLTFLAIFPATRMTMDVQEDAFDREIVEGITARASFAGHRITISARRDYDSLTHDYERKKFDGIVWIRMMEEDRELCCRLRDTGVPQAVAGRVIDGVPSISFEPAEAIVECFNFFRMLGHRSVGLLNAYSRTNPTSISRKNIFSKLLGPAAEKYHADVMPGTLEATLRSLFANAPEITALIVGGHYLQAAAFSALNTLGVRFPEDLSLICLDRTAMAKCYAPPVTVYAQPLEEIGAQAVCELERFVFERTFSPGPAILKGDLISRKSCGCPRTWPLRLNTI